MILGPVSRWSQETYAYINYADKYTYTYAYKGTNVQIQAHAYNIIKYISEIQFTMILKFQSPRYFCLFFCRIGFTFVAILQSQ